MRQTAATRRPQRRKPRQNRAARRRSQGRRGVTAAGLPAGQEATSTTPAYRASLNSVVLAAYDGLLHAKQKLCLFMIAYGILHADRLGVAAVGRSMAKQFGTQPKHGIKQVDRALSNGKLTMKKLFEGYVSLVVGGRRQLLVTLDWTDFDDDDHTTLCVSLVSKTKRAIPLTWMTVTKSSLKGRQRGYERDLLASLQNLVPDDARIIVLADKGFGDVALYEHIRGRLGYNFIIRFRPNIRVEYDGEMRAAGDLVPSNGRVRVVENTVITGAQAGPWSVVLVKKAGMKDPWCLATSLSVTTGRRVVSWYSRRFECEESFRDLKDPRYGYGLRSAKIRDRRRRDRMLLLFALTYLLQTLMGVASERVGADSTIRANTSRERTHSLFRQGRELIGNVAGHVYERLKETFCCLADALIDAGLQNAIG